MQALPSSNLPLVYQLDVKKLVNALPYIDKPMDNKTKKKINKMIKKELENMSKSEEGYLESIKEPETPKIDALIKEFENKDEEHQPILAKRGEQQFDIRNSNDMIKCNEELNKI